MTCSIASSTESTTLTASTSARNSSAQSSSRRPRAASSSPAARACARRRAARRRRRAARRSARGRNAAATSAWTSSVSAALQTPGRWVLALSDDRLGARRGRRARRRRRGSCPTPRRSPGTVATALSAFFSPSPPRGMIRSTTPSWPASSASSSRPPPATSDDRARGQAGRLGRLARHRGEHRVGVRRRRRAAQHDRVAGLQAQRGGVDRDVRAAPRRRRRRRRAARAPCARRGRWAAGSRRSPRRPGRAARRSSRTPRGDRGDAALRRAPGGRAARPRARTRAGLQVARVGLEDLGVRASSASAIA